MARKPVEPVKQQQAPLLMIGSETAPLIFANGVYSFGVRSGVAHLTLITRRDIATAADAPTIPRLYVTADLRIPVADLAAFREAIDKVMLLASNPAGALAS